MALVKSVAVFCGAQSGNDPAHREAARAMGAGLARRGMRLIYGGGRVGLMGAVADAALAAGGAVTGVIPEFLTRWEVAHEGVADMKVTGDMHTRKRLMFDQADVFVTLPGGLGTLDETIEIVTWRQLGLHDKPVLICDVAGSAAPLLATFEAAITAGFAAPGIRGLYATCDGVAAVFDRLESLSAGAPSRSDRL